MFDGREVPPVLLGGNHEEIRRWRREQSLRRTWERRPELLREAALTQSDLQLLADCQAERRGRGQVWLALVHYPVYNKKHEVINCQSLRYLWFGRLLFGAAGSRAAGADWQLAEALAIWFWCALQPGPTRGFE